jgi:ubiquinone/menaquinone biosynthesis C-methylase UbiE
MSDSRENALSIINTFIESIPDERYSKVISSIFLFDFLDLLIKDGLPKNWLENFRKSSLECSNSLNFLSYNLDRDLPISSQGLSNYRADSKDVAYQTGEVYYELWKDFGKKEYFDKTTKILLERFSKNKISLKNFNNVLDDGCGSGRYTLALKELGVNNAVGIDVSQNSIDFANKMNIFKDDVSFLKASVLDLPFEDEKFDFVFSNGVLHHTTNTLLGLEEIYRVLKPGGSCWLYLYGGKNSFFWDVVDCCRNLLNDVPEAYTIEVMKTLGYSSGRIFHRNDFFYVPIHNRYYEKEVTNMLHQVGFNKFKKLDRGTENDWDEIIYNHPNIDPYIYGEGEMRFIIEK